MPVDFDAFNYTTDPAGVTNAASNRDTMPTADFAAWTNAQDSLHRFGYAGLVDLYQKNEKDHAMFQDDGNGNLVPNQFIGVDEAMQTYGVKLQKGTLASEATVKFMQGQQTRYQAAQETLSRAPQDILSQGGILTAGMAAGLLDPVNLAVGLIPFVGEAREASLLAKFGKPIGRLVTGAIEGAAGNAAMVPLEAATAQAFNYDYDGYDIFTNIAVGAAFGSALHFGGGLVADRAGSFLSKDNIRPKGSWVEQLTPEDHGKAMQTALGQILQDQRVEVQPIIRLALDEKYPHLKDISPIHFIKSAADSADVFSKHLDEVDGLVKFQDDLKQHLSQSEQRIMGLTGKTSLDEAQSELAHNVDLLSNMLGEYQKAAETTPDTARKLDLYETMGVLNKELEEHKQALDALHENRSLVEESGPLLDSALNKLEMKRSDIAVSDPVTNGEHLNIETDKGPNQAIFSKYSGLDLKLLQKAALVAQDLNQIPEINENTLMEMAQNLQSKEGQWFYSPEIIKDIQTTASEIPKVLDSTTAQKMADIPIAQLGEKMQSLLSPEQLKVLDKNITDSKKIGEVTKIAAQCIIEALG